MEAHPVIPDILSARADAQQAQFSPLDYGREGDTRPYQVVMPDYPAPKFLNTFANLNAALRECGTLCAMKGRPFRLVRWGARVPCLPCKQGRSPLRMPTVKAQFSPGALEGFPEATPIAEFDRSGVWIYGPRGNKHLVGQPNYLVTRTPFPTCKSCQYFPTPQATSSGDIAAPPQHYVEAVKSAQYIADREGRRTYVCAGFGSSCKGRDPQKWMPVVYAQPGGLVARYPYERDFGPGTVYGSTSVKTDVTPGEYRELIRESEGGTFLPQGA